MTRNYSAEGVFFVTEQSALVGAPIDFFVTISHSALGFSFRLRCKGLVMRVEPAQGKTGVAIAIDAYSFE
jgi:hypothetical protein